MDEFPTEEELLERYCASKKFLSTQEKIILTPDCYDTIKEMSPRYYQQIAIDSVIQAIAQGQRRLLLVMATGTGKTFTAFQIVWKLLKSNVVSRVLYLADRNILIDQTMAQDFGEPIYTYSLKQGILDGFLAPYKVIRVNIDKDLSGWRP